ncbi:N(G),N(G)-dimethylarginine dimethylaminohydrolase 2 [Platysternon megacephalum]|uniref:N(G),N(G)-dimethylarginine dimethylaminohydrolase 2 n=1 Tax=Platysternon megacephalum TaxID=55544 RepID=A0A4D9DR73_9SAUR|nr:N(G),N(G)-dimethylarginine dimethylaminohydrolase 2 [Platysternon megacephalum]
MGNANKGLTPPPSSKPTPEGMVERLREDVTCSICLDVLNDPVSIECGHNFCRGCLAAHWSGVSARGPRCPECRAPCSRDRMIPDTRVKSLVEKIRDLPCGETLTATGTASPEQQPGAQPEPGRPVQLVRLDEEGGVSLDEEALSRRLEQGGDVKDGSWMGREEEPLEGFEWRVGVRSVTKGVWAWSQPFWVPTERGKVAVLLVDTEGSMDIARDTETSILNVSSQLKDPDLEYLEKFSDLMKKHHCGFSSPAQMAITFHNQRVLDRARADHALFLKEKDGDSRNPITCLGVRPSKMAAQLAERRGQLLWRCRTDMREPAPETEAQLTELEAELTREAETFLESYRKRYKKFAILAGVGAGALVLGPVGGAAGAGIAGAVIAAEAAGALAVAEVVAIGVGAGAAAGIVVGGGVGGGVGGKIARKDRQRAEAAGGGREEGNGTEDPSDDKPLI